MSKLLKSQSAPLNVTQQANHRIFAGLGWDPHEDKGLIKKAKAISQGKQMHHDLDLACYVYDKEARYICHICAESGQQSDQTGKIYHSGDNIEGVGDGDDEQISVELKDIDPVIDSIIFAASIKSGHSFDEISNPEIRLADGYSGHEFVHRDLSDVALHGANLYAFIRVYRSGDGWAMHYIDEAMSSTDGHERPALLKKFI